MMLSCVSWRVDGGIDKGLDGWNRRKGRKAGKLVDQHVHPAIFRPQAAARGWTYGGTSLHLNDPSYNVLIKHNSITQLIHTTTRPFRWQPCPKQSEHAE